MNKTQLFEKCKELGITKYHSKNKSQLIDLICNKMATINQIPAELEPSTIVNTAALDTLPDKWKFIDLFCGIGGFHQALTTINGECVFACDIDESCRQVYEENYGLKPEKDITQVDIHKIPNFDILCAGFPCFLEGTDVLTHQGYKPIETVGINDKLLTHKGNFQHILNLQKKIYTGALYELEVKYHFKPIVCTEEHPFYVRTRREFHNSDDGKYHNHDGSHHNHDGQPHNNDGSHHNNDGQPHNPKKYIFDKPTWKKANELTMNDYYGMVINKNEIIPEFMFNVSMNYDYVDHTIFKLDKPNYWFMMGYFIGNGWIGENTEKEKQNYTIYFYIKNKHESEIINKINNIFTISDTKRNSDNYKTFSGSNYIWYTILKQFGKYSYEKQIPEWVHNAPVEFIRYFMNGYIHSKGHIMKNNFLQFTTTSYYLLYGLQRLYLKLGHIFSMHQCIRSKPYYIDGIIVKQRNQYCLIGTLKNNQNITSFIENEYAWFSPCTITKKDIVNTPVYNFEVDKDNSYIVENVCVHNCQPFSKAGYQKGFDDDRGNLFFHICNIVTHHNPKYLLLENVRNLSSHDDGNTWKVIYENINRLGYYTYSEPVILNVLHFNIPQNRERVIIMCKRKDLGELPVLPIIPSNPKLNLTREIKDIICDKEETRKYTIDGKLKDVESVWDLFIKIIIQNHIDMPKFPIWTDWWDNPFETNDPFYIKYTSWIDKNRDFYNTHKPVLEPWLITSRNNKNWIGAVRKFEWQAGELMPDDGMHTVLWSARGSGIRVKRCNYIPTLVAMSMIPVYGPESRKLSPRELLRLQSFPDTFQFHEKTIYKQVGNAVNVKMIEKCARFLIMNESLF